MIVITTDTMMMISLIFLSLVTLLLLYLTGKAYLEGEILMSIHLFPLTMLWILLISLWIVVFSAPCTGFQVLQFGNIPPVCSQNI